MGARRGNDGCGRLLMGAGRGNDGCGRDMWCRAVATYITVRHRLLQLPNLRGSVRRGGSVFGSDENVNK